jgi:hypothetical protein
MTVSVVFHDTVSAQDRAEVKRIIENINAFYAKTPDFQNEVVYNLYKNHTGEDVVESEHAVALKSRQSSWFQMGDIETLSDDQYDIMVHHTDKVIVVANHKQAAVNPLMHLYLDTLLSMCSHFELGTYGQVGCMYLAFDASEATGISICYHLSDYSLYSLTTYYRSERKMNNEPDAPMIRPRLEIKYEKTLQHPIVNPKKMQSAWFVRKVGDQFKTTEKYKDYRVINQVIEN